jgi:hypothetical protein
VCTYLGEFIRTTLKEGSPPADAFEFMTPLAEPDASNVITLVVVVVV